MWHLGFNTFKNELRANESFAIQLLVCDDTKPTFIWHPVQVLCHDTILSLNPIDDETTESTKANDNFAPDTFISENAL